MVTVDFLTFWVEMVERLAVDVINGVVRKKQ